LLVIVVSEVAFSQTRSSSRAVFECDLLGTAVRP
jgi:hypothetical protein